MKLIEVPGLFEGLAVVEIQLYKDERGFFVERFNEREFEKLGLPVQFRQDNHSLSLPRVLRGLHFQLNPAQGKLVGVTRGRILDVVVDLRPESPTFKKHFKIELSADLGRLLWIPPRFAHGFCVLGSEPADVFYKVDQLYNPKGDFGIRWNDPELAIQWPYDNPLVSEKDQRLPLLSQCRKDLDVSLVHGVSTP